MKAIAALLLLGMSLTSAHAEVDLDLDLGPELKPLEKHEQGSEEVAVDQDELSADVQQLVIEQTNPKVIELLGEVENIMDEATEMLLVHDTGGDTIAAQTEIIEKIHAAAKQKQQQSGSESGGAMMDMMERMMGKKPGNKPGQQPGQQPGQGEQPGDQAGQGQTGDSDSANTEQGGPGSNADETRRVPKASGTAPGSIPQEYRSAFDAYNRGAEQLVK